VPRYEIEDASVAGIDRETLAVAAPVFVAAELEGHVGALEGAATVFRAENGAIGSARVGIGAARQVDPIGVGRIDGDGLDAHQVHILIRHPVQNRLPAMRGVIPASGSGL
jgi:hypothetical protein